MEGIHLMNDRHLNCQFEGCIELTEGGSPQSKWCKAHRILMRKAQQAKWHKENRSSLKTLGSRGHVFSFDISKVIRVREEEILWETGICNRCGQTLLLERCPLGLKLIYQLRCVVCGQLVKKEVKNIVATEPLKQKLTRTIENWEEIYVQRKRTMVRFCDLSEAEQATILRAWLEQYIQGSGSEMGSPNTVGPTDGT